MYYLFCHRSIFNHKSYNGIQMVRDTLLSTTLLFSLAYVGLIYFFPVSFFYFLLPSKGGLLALLCAVWHPALRKSTSGSRRWWDVSAWSFAPCGPAHRKQSVWQAARGDCTTWARPRTLAASEPVGSPSPWPAACSCTSRGSWPKEGTRSSSVCAEEWLWMECYYWIEYTFYKNIQTLVSILFPFVCTPFKKPLQKALNRHVR